MGKNQSKQLEGKWVVATDALEDGEKKFVGMLLSNEVTFLTSKGS